MSMLSNDQQLKKKLGEYLAQLEPYKKKLDPEDFFVLGLVVGNMVPDSNALSKIVKSLYDQKKLMSSVVLNDDQLLEYRSSLLNRYKNPSSSEDSSQQQQQQQMNGSANKKRSQEEAQIENDNNLNQNNKKKLISISEADIEDDDSDSMPDYKFDCKKNSNLKEFYYPERNNNTGNSNKKQYGGQNKLGFIGQEEPIEDLNKAIESLDNTQFRSSLKDVSDENNELSQELPLANNGRDHHSFDEDNAMIDDTLIQKEFSFNQFNPSKSKNQLMELPKHSKNDNDLYKISYENENSLGDLLQEENKMFEVEDDQDFLFAQQLQQQMNGQQKKNHPQFDENEQATKDLIEMLQREDKQNLEAIRMQREKEDIKDFICKVCYDDFNEENVFPLSNCEDVFHSECLQMYLKSEISEGKFPLKCPEIKCSKDLMIEDLNNLLTKEEKEKFYDFTFNQAVDKQQDLSWCPTANCNYAFVFEEGEDIELNCAKCKKHYCLNCRVIFHKGQSCKEYQISNTRDKNDDAFMKFAKGAKLKQCPFCNHWVQKTEGCDHMKCRCGKDFCYKCGGVYMKCECQKKQQALNQQRFERARRLREQAQQRRKAKKEQDKKLKQQAEQKEMAAAKNQKPGSRGKRQMF